MPQKSDSSCDWAPARKKGKPPQRKGLTPPPRTRLMRHRADHSWTGVKTERYKLDDGTWADVIRRTLVGDKGEGAKFHLRYFEIAPGGHTTLERHRHEHVVIGARGRGRCKVRRNSYEIEVMDTLYIPPDAPHQLKNPYREPFGFFCIVDAKRDRPRPV